MKVVVNKCPHTGVLIEDDKEYKRHMRDTRLRIKEDAEREAFALTFDEFIQPMFEVTSAEALSEWLTENYWLYARHHGYRNHRWRRPGSKYPYYKPEPEDKVKVTVWGLKFSDKISTSHSSPRGEPSNWHLRGSYTEYGWDGHIKIEFEGQAYKFFCSEQFKALSIHTASGGGSPTSASYGIRLFAKDFKKLAGLEVFKKLSGQNVFG